MNDEGSLFLLLLGPAGATALYWVLYRYYRNTDKSHAFERETKIDARPVTGSERKVSEIKGTRATQISGNNVGDYRERVRRLRDESG